MILPSLEGVPPQYQGRLIEAIERSLKSFRFFCRYWLGFDPHEKQREMARPVPFIVMACGSGVGKSTGAAAFLLWEAWRHDHHAYGAFAPTNRQVKFLVEDIAKLILLGGSKFALFIRRKPTKDDPYLELTNGTRIYFLNTAYGAENSRGLEVNGALMDEAALDTEDTFNLVRTRARLTPGWVRLLSTPRGKGGWFFAEAQRAAEEMRVAEKEQRAPKKLFITATSYDNPHYDRAILVARKAEVPERVWLQEYMGQFIDLEGASLKQEDIDRVFDATWDGEDGPRPDGLYAHGWDLGQVNYTVGITGAYDRLENVWGDVRGVDFEEFRGERYATMFDRIEKREARWGEGEAESTTILDATGGGRIIDEQVDVDALGFLFNKKTRAEMNLRLIGAFEKPNRLRLPRHWSRLYTQCQLHTAKEDAPGETWDHWDSLGLMYWLAFERTVLGSRFVRLS